jgi:transcriptional regulator with XRE-family HTH domain
LLYHAEQEIMPGRWLTVARERKGWTQEEAAAKLGVSQAYVSQLERGKRPVTKLLLAKLQRHFDVPPTQLPAEPATRAVDAQALAESLGALGYPGFSHMKRGYPRNPAQVLLAALQQDHLEARLAEALPWVVLHYPNLDWRWLVERAKLGDLQNRLAFLLVLAEKLAARQGDTTTASQFAALVDQLERARLAREDTFGRNSMTRAERVWLAGQRSQEAQHWNLLTDLTAERLPYAP